MNIQVKEIGNGGWLAMQYFGTRDNKKWFRLIAWIQLFDIQAE
jgi:hypothetical protein